MFYLPIFGGRIPAARAGAPSKEKAGWNFHPALFRAIRSPGNFSASGPSAPAPVIRSMREERRKIGKRELLSQRKFNISETKL